MEAAAFVRQRHRARRPVEQAHTDASLKPRHGATNARLSEPKRFSSPDEITRLHHRGQDADAAEQPAI
jgi:hypothetical protein